MKKTIKRVLRPIYSYSRYIYSRYVREHLMEPVELSSGLSVTQISSAKESFFGYYNLSPENIDGKILFCVPQKGAKGIDVCYKEGAKEVIIGSTEAFNWQQGCMAQWGGAKNSHLIYYNTYDASSNSYICKVYNTELNKEIDALPMPIYSVSKDESFMLTLSFERLAKMRPDYGYFCKNNDILLSDENDGIWRVDLDSKRPTLIITLQQLKELRPSDTMFDAMHKVNHIDISPDGNRFMFLHRWIGPRGRYMRLITANADGSDIYILNGDKMTSHSYWKDNETIISFCFTEKYGDAYVFFKDKTTIIVKVSDLLPMVDGHPSVSRNECIVTDSYPSYNRMSRLFLFKNDTVKCLGRFYQPLKFVGPYRVDLHPKWNLQGNTVYFESGHSGQRRLYCINVSSCE